MRTESGVDASPTLRTSDIVPWDSPVDGDLLLQELARRIARHVVLPEWGAESLALWTLHTYAFHLRQVTAYIGLESPEKRCGKTTLLAVLSQLVRRPVVAANISSSAFFRVIEELQPTLLIDEADTFLHGNEQLRGILNSGYTRQTAYVVRVRNASAPEDSNGNGTSLATFSSWCPKIMAAIGHLPETLADRCIVLRMHRKTASESCDRLANLDSEDLRRQCARLILDHATDISSARPSIPTGLNDRAADIWEPLFVLADLAGGPWPSFARDASLALTGQAEDQNPIATLFVDIFCQFLLADADRLFSRQLVASLNGLSFRSWGESRAGKGITETWLARQLRPYGIRPRTMWIRSEAAKGYLKEDFVPICRRYITKAELEELKLHCTDSPEPPPPSVDQTDTELLATALSPMQVAFPFLPKVAGQT